jgi:pimeloyl-ACP methyl ester carboxylesterase
MVGIFVPSEAQMRDARFSDEETIMTQSGITAPPQPEIASPEPSAVREAILGDPTDMLIVTPAGDTSIRPFTFHASDEELADLQQRIAATRWPSAELVSDGTQGVQLATMRRLADYWANRYDWRAFEARLNALPMFVTNIDGVDVHFIHVRSAEAGALPLILTHGWPGSVVEELKIIDPLTNPTASGGDPADAFHVVIPSMPGYGFSGKPTELGWDPVRIARAWTELMGRLGYSQFVASGGDWGDPVTEQLAVLFPTQVRGIHLNMPSAVPSEIFQSLGAGSPAPEGLSADEEQAYAQLGFFFRKGLAYAQEMTNRPQTLYAIEDSPIGLAAWILDHDARSYELIARVFDGHEEGLTRDDILDNISLYWLTRTGVSSARLYWENKLPFFAPQGVTVPVAVSAFPDELYQVPRSWAERAFPQLVHYNRLPKGGHFAAWEQPALFAQELRSGFHSLRQGG